MTTATAGRTGSLIIRGAQVWDGLERGFVTRDLGIINGRVMEDRSTHAASDEPEVIDGAGRWVIPGLIDAHFHAYAVSMD